MRKILFLLLLTGFASADQNLDTAIGWLKSAQEPNTGEINHFGVWGTAWGTIALSLYGENESVLNKSLGYIAASQNNDGGIPYELGSPWGSGVDYCAPAILAFVHANKTPYSLNKNGKTPMDFILGTQGASGGFGEWGEDVVSTSLAVIALGTIGENLTKTGKDPVAFILSKQNPTDGGFEWWTKSEATTQALIALNIAGMNNSNTTAGLNYLKGIQNTTTGMVVDPYVTALSALAFHSYGWDQQNAMAVSYLKSIQNESGRIGKTGTAQASDALTTALSALAFSNFSFKSADANVSCESIIPGGGSQRCYVNSSVVLPLSRFELNGKSYYANGVEKTFENLTAGDYTIRASSFGVYGHALYRTRITHTNFSVDGLVTPAQNQKYNLGDVVTIFARNLENASAYVNGEVVGGIVENRTYTYNFVANQTGNFTLTFNISGAITERNFTISDSYTVQIANPGSCAIGAASSIAFNVLDANGNAVSNATVFACFSGACAQTDSGSYAYTCAGTNSFYVNASKNGNFGSAGITFSGANPPSGGGGSYVTVEIEFPPNSGRHDISRVLNFGECEYAYDCFTKAAPIECSWWSAVGGLACPGSTVSKTCLATGVDGVKASSNGWWSFYTNGAFSQWGISCYKVNSGDKIKFKYAGEYKTENTQPNVPEGSSVGPTGLATAPLAPAKNTKAPPKESAPKPVLVEKGGFRMAENAGTALLSYAKKSTVKIVSGANAPCPTCDFASALLLKSGLDALNTSTEVTTDDLIGNCPEKDIVVFVGGPAANRGVPPSYSDITGTTDGAIYNMSANCFVVAGNTRELTNKAVTLLMETFK